MTTPEISRKQAWCKLAVLIADGLPEPKSIDFNAADPSIFTIHVDSLAAFNAWARALHCVDRSANPVTNGQVQHVAIGHRAWNGCTAWLYAYLPDDAPEPVADDMDAVRAIAEQADTCVCCSPGDCGDRSGHVRSPAYAAAGSGDRCNCGRDWPCTEVA